MREAILEVIRGGSVVKNYVKLKIDEWFSNISIFRHEGEWVVDDRLSGYRSFEEDTAAVDHFIRTVFNKKNLAICYKGIRKHKMAGQEFEDMEESEIRKLVKRYRDEHFDDDYPFAREGKG